MLKTNEVLCDYPVGLPPKQPAPDIPIIAMEEISPGRYWVLVNFPGRTSLSLSTDADLDLASALVAAANAVARESLAYAASLQEGAL